PPYTYLIVLPMEPQDNTWRVNYALDRNRKTRYTKIVEKRAAKAWRQTHKELARWYVQKRWLLKRAAGSFELAEWQLLKQWCDFKCLGCNKVEPVVRLTADHIVPVSKGGANHIDNIQPLCVVCNSTKRAKTMFAV